ncbi:MBL fold metallo-hydrolase [Kitasatospora sp. NPDC028055]|uniref:MBL fold metallo-hydrolase n=1 Tax=Kitasatospora sp. NPDC028055 TaxID=3155653 RepID=UPI0033CADF65
MVRTGGRAVLVDTGVGDGRERPGRVMCHRCRGRFLELLAEAGVRPGDVDIVVNTHLHVDHVGWNIREREGRWVRAFPDAVYHVPADDLAFFDPAVAPPARTGGGVDPAVWAQWDQVFADSVAPVPAAGQGAAWGGTRVVGAGLVLEQAPGHTAGSCVLRLESVGGSAVFVGDLLRSPVQLAHPACGSCFCLDPDRAAAGRRRILQQAVERRELVVPAHFAGPGAARVERSGAGFAPRWARWARWAQDSGVPAVPPTRRAPRPRGWLFVRGGREVAVGCLPFSRCGGCRGPRGGCPLGVVGDGGGVPAVPPGAAGAPARGRSFPGCGGAPGPRRLPVRRAERTAVGCPPFPPVRRAPWA